MKAKMRSSTENKYIGRTYIGSSQTCTYFGKTEIGLWSLKHKIKK